MSKKQKYDLTHRIAKFIVFFLNTILLLLSEKYNLTYVLVIVNFTYFFGVNSIAWLIEEIFKSNHGHNKI